MIDKDFIFQAKTLTEEISVLRSECLKLSRELESHDEDSSLVEGILNT